MQTMAELRPVHVHSQFGWAESTLALLSAHHSDVALQPTQT